MFHRPFAIMIALAAVTTASMTNTLAAAASGQQVRVIAACAAPKYKPTKYIFACADGNNGMKNAAYDWWTAKTAHGTATFYYNDCTPNCAAGHFHFVRAEFTLFRVVQTTKSGPLFSRASVDTRQGHQVYYLPTSTM